MNQLAQVIGPKIYAEDTRVVKIGYKPRSVFRPLHFAEQRHAVIVAHRRAGKTVSSVNELIKRVLKVPLPAPRGCYIAPTYAQAKDIAWQYVKDYSEPLPGTKFSESELKVDLPNGGRIRLYGAENIDRLRGLYFDAAVVDEYASLDAAIWTEVLQPALSDRKGRAIFLGTPKGRDAFYDLWRKALKNPREWFTLMLRASETGIIPPEELALMRESMTENQYMREMECDFTVEGTDQFISLGEVEEAIDRPAAANGPIVMGVDPARFGDDRTAMVIRQSDVILHIETWQNADLMRTAMRVADAIESFKPQAIFVDGIGVGAGVVDRLKELQYSNIIDINSSKPAVDRTKYHNLRAEMWWKMRDWVRNRASLPNHRELMDDLTSLLYEFDKSNRVKLESKDELRKRDMPSPDLADALALTFAQHVASADVVAYYNKNKRRQYAADIADPFESL